MRNWNTILEIAAFVLIVLIFLTVAGVINWD